MKKLVYIGNLNPKCSQDDLYKIFHNFGPIKKIKIFSLEYQGLFYPIGYACIQFLDKNGYFKCLSFDKNLNLYNNKIEIYSRKPETPFSRSIFAFFSSDSITEESIFLLFQLNQPSKINFVSKPTINKYGFVIIEFSSAENRDFALYDYFRGRSLISNSSRLIYKLLTFINPSSDLIDLSISEKIQTKTTLIENQNNVFLSINNFNEANDNNYSNFFNETDSYNSPSISFSPSGVTYFENKYYERYLDLLIIHKYPKYKEYRVNSFLASTFSVRIRQLLMENAIIEKIESRFDIDGPFELVTNFLLGMSIDITVENSFFLFIASCDFGIESLRQKTYGYSFNQMTIEKAFEMHHYLRKFNVFEGPHSDYLALHFDQILLNLKKFFSGNEKSKENDEIDKLHFLAAILRNKLFTVENSSLFSKILLEFIKENEKEENQRRKFLIQFLKMKEMEIEEAKAVVDDKSLNLNQISKPIYSFLKEKSKKASLKLISNQNQNQNSFQIERCFYDHSSQTNTGIFSRLRQIYENNPHDLGIINITSSSTIENIIDNSNQKNSKEWISSNMRNSWICFNFFENPIILTAYALKYQEDKNEDIISNQLISWKIEGSDDMENWTLIDERRNEQIIDFSNEDYEFDSARSSTKRRRRKKSGNQEEDSQKFSRFKWKIFQIENNNNNSNNNNNNNNEIFQLENNNNNNNSNNSKKNNNSNNNNNNNNSYNNDEIFQIENNNDENCFQFIKLTQIGRNSSNNFCLKMQGIEFYGEIPSQLTEIPYSQDHSKFQNGIFALFSENCENSNPVKSGLVSISSSCDAKFLVDENFSGYWRSQSIERAFVEVDLKLMKLELKSYSLKFCNSSENMNKSWKIEASNDGNTWILVDQRVIINDYESKFEIFHWDCQNPYVDPIRYIRITNLNKNTGFCLAQIEMYGILYCP